MGTQSPNQPLLELHDIIYELKHDIATIVIEMREMFHQQATKMMLAHPKKTRFFSVITLSLIKQRRPTLVHNWIQVTGIC